MIRELSATVLSGNKQHVSFSKDPTPNCKVCKAARHAVKWAELRMSERSKETLPRGSLCYCCIRATLAFGVGCRSFEVFRQVPGHWLFGGPDPVLSATSSRSTTEISAHAALAFPLMCDLYRCGKELSRGSVGAGRIAKASTAYGVAWGGTRDAANDVSVSSQPSSMAVVT